MQFPLRNGLAALSLIATIGSVESEEAMPIPEIIHDDGNLRLKLAR